MSSHNFIFSPANWLGQGTIELSMAEEPLAFYTRWKINPPNDAGIIECTQEIEITGVSDLMRNEFNISRLSNGKFELELTNHAMGNMKGKGLIDERMIAWEFRVPDVGFEGYEIYEVQEDGTYKMRAEYASADQFRTQITGNVWKKTEKAKKK